MLYGKVHRLGSKEHGGFDESQPVVVQEKVDGSQFAFHLTADGGVACYSRTREIEGHDPMFAMACATAKASAQHLTIGHLYVGEALSGRRQNVLMYDRAPRGGLVLFEVQDEAAKSVVFDCRDLADRIGCDAVAIIYEGAMPSKDELRAMATGHSATLGGQREGIVVKQANPYSRCKIVADNFAEVKIIKAEKAESPVAGIGQAFAQPARFEKALQHLKEQGKIKGDNSDIRLLIDEVRRDMFDEEKAAISDALFSVFAKDVARAAVAPVAKWYMNRLDGSET